MIRNFCLAFSLWIDTDTPFSMCLDLARSISFSYNGKKYYELAKVEYSSLLIDKDDR